MRAEAQWLLLSCGVIIGGLLWAVVGYEAGVDLLRTTGLVVAAGGVGMFFFVWGAAR